MSFIFENTINNLFACGHHEDVIFDSELRFSFGSSPYEEILHGKIRLNKYTQNKEAKTSLLNDRNKSFEMEVLNIIV